MKTDQNYFTRHGFGKDAPWIDLANSYEMDGFGKATDHLAHPEWLPLFLRHWRLAKNPALPAPTAELLRLRELLRSVAQRLADGALIRKATIAELNAHFSVPAQQRLLQRQNGQHPNGFEVALLPANGDEKHGTRKSEWPWIFSRIVASLAETLANKPLDRIRLCSNDGCRWIFYDHTKGNTRRWCNDRTCGNRDRVRRARAAAARRKKLFRK